MSYSGAVHATKKKPYVSTDDRAARDAALASGCFAEVGRGKREEAAVTSGPVPGTAGIEEEQAPAHATELSKMTTDELKAYAAINGIDIGSAKKKESILGDVMKAEEQADQARRAIRGE